MFLNYPKEIAHLRSYNLFYDNDYFLCLNYFNRSRLGSLQVSSLQPHVTPLNATNSEFSISPHCSMSNASEFWTHPFSFIFSRPGLFKSAQDVITKSTFPRIPWSKIGYVIYYWNTLRRSYLFTKNLTAFIHILYSFLILCILKNNVLSQLKSPDITVIYISHLASGAYIDILKQYWWIRFNGMRIILSLYNFSLTDAFCKATRTHADLLPFLWTLDYFWIRTWTGIYTTKSYINYAVIKWRCCTVCLSCRL